MVPSPDGRGAMMITGALPYTIWPVLYGAILIFEIIACIKKRTKQKKRTIKWGF